MATTNFKGQPVKLIGEFIQVGKVAPDFELVKTDLSSFSLKDLNGKNVILNIFPSLDTSVCATSVRKFNKMAAGLKDTVVLAISKDLPFAHGRFCRCLPDFRGELERFWVSPAVIFWASAPPR